MADTSDIKKGFKMLIDGVPFAVVDHQFVKPGKGQAFIRTRIKNMMTGAVIDRTFKSGEKLEKADTEESLTNEQLGDNVHYLLDGTEVDIMLFEGRPIGVTPPTFVELLVTETEPGFKGDTSSNTTKPAMCETGLQVNVPLFVNAGDKLKVDTRTGDYVERVKG
jgi:elongation factor P